MGQVDEFDPGPGEVLRLGRHAAAELRFDPERDLSVSGYHAHLTLGAEPGLVVLEDLGSANGTLVNGAPINGAIQLHSGDIISLGRNGPRLRFETVSRDATTLSAKLPDTLTQGLATTDASAVDEGGKEAGEPAKRSVGPRTVEIMIRQATEHASRRLGRVTWLLLLLACLLLASVAVIIVLVVVFQDSAEESTAHASRLTHAQEALERGTSELSRTKAELGAVRAEIHAERRRQNAQNLAARVEQARAVQAQLAEARVEVSEEMREEFRVAQEEVVASLTSVETRITSDTAGALFMLVAHPDVASGAAEAERTGSEEGFCTAFAVRADGWLVTNAHCVESMFELRYGFARKGMSVRFYAKRNGDSQRAYPLLLETARVHPHYTHAASPDVALVRVQLNGDNGDRLPTVVTLASADSARSLAVGEPIYTLGFPGKVMDPHHVVADFRGGHVARLTGFDGDNREAASNRFVWHTALITKGTSGSPIFDRSGRVVAVNNGTMSAEQVLTSDGTTQEVRYVYSADGLNFGVRVDTLLELLEIAHIRPPSPGAFPAAP